MLAKYLINVKWQSISRPRRGGDPNSGEDQFVQYDFLSASLRFACPPGKENWPWFDPAGEAGRLMETVASWKLTDDRWRLLGDLSFVRKMTFGRENAVLYCFPAIIKLRWRAGAPADAKAYLIAGEVPGGSDQAC